jgi:comEA protein
MNGKERLAGAVLLATLAIGIIADIFGGQQGGKSFSPAACDRESISTAEPLDGFRRIDLNAATAEELQILPGVGPKKAEAIVEYRDRHGLFDSPCRLTEVKGIGEKTLERIKPYVFVSGEVPRPSD